MIERWLNKKKLKDKKYRNVKIFASDIIQLLKNIVKNFKFKNKYVKKCNESEDSLVTLTDSSPAVWKNCRLSTSS